MPRELTENLEMYNSLIRNLAIRRELIGRSQTEVAKIAGLANANYVCNIEKCKSPIPIPRIEQFARGYDVDPGMLAKAIIFTRYPEMWSTYYEILHNEPNLDEKSDEEHVQHVLNFCQRIQEMSPDENE